MGSGKLSKEAILLRGVVAGEAAIREMLSRDDLSEILSELARWQAVLKHGFAEVNRQVFRYVVEILLAMVALFGATLFGGLSLWGYAGSAVWLSYAIVFAWGVAVVCYLDMVSDRVGRIQCIRKSQKIALKLHGDLVTYVLKWAKEHGVERARSGGDSKR